MPTIRVTGPDVNLSPVLGPLTGPQRASIVERLTSADNRLGEIAETLAGQDDAEWSYEGVVLTLSESGQTSIDAALAESTGKVAFTAQLRPGNFFPTEVGMWQPGRAPLRMSTDSWDVDGGLSIRYRKRITGRPFVITDQVVEIDERHFDDPVGAVAAFAEVCDELAELALSREATVEAWRPPEEEGAAGAGQAPAPSI